MAEEVYMFLDGCDFFNHLQNYVVRCFSLQTILQLAKTTKIQVESTHSPPNKNQIPKRKGRKVPFLLPSSIHDVGSRWPALCEIRCAALYLIGTSNLGVECCHHGGGVHEKNRSHEQLLPSSRVLKGVSSNRSFWNYLPLVYRLEKSPLPSKSQNCWR